MTADGDGRSELVVGYTDRVVRAFRWEEPSDGSELGSGQLVLLKKWLLEGQVHSLNRESWGWGLVLLEHINTRASYPTTRVRLMLMCRWTVCQ